MRARTVTAPTSQLVVLNDILEGAASDVFKITIPDDASETWSVGYECTDGGACNDYLPYGYFKQGASNDTVEEEADADPLAGNADHADKNMTLLNGYTISGTLTAPFPVTEVGGMRVRMKARDVGDATSHFNSSVTISQGASQADYGIAVSLDGGAEWAVSYACDTAASPVECAKYISSAYYDDGGTVVDFSDVDPYLPGGNSHSAINLTMLTGNTISGDLLLSHEKAPAGGIDFTVNAQNVSGSGGLFFTHVTMQEGEDRVSYTINVDTDAGKSYRVGFDCLETITPVCEKLSDQRYYDASSGDTIDIEGDADPLSGSASHTDIDLVVESSKFVDEFCLPVKSGKALVVICI